jgi:hypothetical protein
MSRRMSPIETYATNVVTTLLHAVDALDWSTIRASLTPRVTIDYTSLWGGEPETLDADELIDRWRQLLTGFDATQHLTGPVVLTGVGEDDGTATCAATVRGYHHVADEEGGTWMCAGRYDIALDRSVDGWRVSAITLTVAYEDGNRNLVGVARERGETRSGGRSHQEDG